MRAYEATETGKANGGGGEDLAVLKIVRYRRNRPFQYSEQRRRFRRYTATSLGLVEAPPACLYPMHSFLSPIPFQNPFGTGQLVLAAAPPR